MKYNAEIDGLRAYAVFSVLAYHAFPGWFAGGFIGVDVFFVISGYLITRVIIHGFENDSFSLIDFWGRRIRRIFPALIIVIATTLGFGWFALLPNEYALLGKHVAGGAAFVSNIIFWSEAGYFDNLAETKPLLHLWSLAVEEQFYLLWPIILFVVWKIKVSPFSTVLAITAVSFFLNLGQTNSQPSAAFFLPFSRIWELSTGGILAWFLANKNNIANIRQPSPYSVFIWASRNKVYLQNFASLIGLVTLFASSYFMHEELRFPGFWVLFPVLSTVLVISAGPEAWPTKFFLTQPIVVWLGLISYPLYLWHWPILSYLQIIEGEVPSPQIRLIAIFISIILSLGTYYLVELEFKKISSFRAFLLLIPSFILVLLGVNTYIYDGFEGRSSIVGLESQKLEVIFTKDDCPFEFKRVSGCNVENSSFRNTVVILGDSHVRQTFELLKNELRSQQLKIVAISTGGCPYLIETNTKNVSDCDSINGEVSAFLKSYKRDIQKIILAGQWSTYANDGWLMSTDDTNVHLEQALKRTLEQLSADFDVGVADQIPIVPFNPQRCATRPFKSVDKEKCDFEYSESLELMVPSRAIIDKTLANYPKVTRIDFDKVTCPDMKKCTVMYLDALGYFDATHLNQWAMEILSKRVHKRQNMIDNKESQ